VQEIIRRRDLEEGMKKHNINWRREVEQFIERRIRELELEEVMSRINKALSDVPPSEQPAWKQIREDRSR
jgi:hypothetical protein